MATRKRYRKAADEEEPKRKKKYYGKKRDEEEENGEEEEDRSSRRKGRGRDRDGDSPFVYITGLFESKKKRGTFTAFMKDEDGEPNERMLEALEGAIKEGKMIGVSTRGKGKADASLWYIKEDED